MELFCTWLNHHSLPLTWPCLSFLKGTVLFVCFLISSRVRSKDAKTWPSYMGNEPLWDWKGHGKKATESTHRGRSGFTATGFVFLVFWVIFNLFFNWRKTASQCSVGFCHTIMQISHNYTYIPFGHETTDWFKTGKRVRQGCILSPCLFNLHAEYIIRNARLDEAQAGSKTAGEISMTSDMQMTPP